MNTSGNAIAIALALVSAGCGHSTDPVYYALSPSMGHRRATPLKRVKVLRVGLAGYLDRPAIVRRINGNRLELATGDHWAEPLVTMLTRTLAQDLANRLQHTGVFCEGGGLDADADAIVDVSFERLAADGRQLVLLAVVTVQRQERPPTVPQRILLMQDLSTDSVSALVDADGLLIGRLADQIVQILINEDSRG